MINRLFEILDAQWLIHRESALVYLPVLISFLNGGMVYYTDLTADAIKSASKPTVSVIMNMAASAAMWIISATDF